MAKANLRLHTVPPDVEMQVVVLVEDGSDLWTPVKPLYCPPRMVAMEAQSNTETEIPFRARTEALQMWNISV